MYIIIYKKIDHAFIDKELTNDRSKKKKEILMQ